MKNKNTKKAFAFMMHYLKRNMLTVFIGIIALTAVDFAQLIIPRIVSNVLDSLSKETFTEQFIRQKVFIILLLASGMVVLRYIWRFCIIGGARRIERAIRNDMFTHLQSLSFAYFNKTKTGDLMALLINDLNAVRMALGPALVSLVDTLFLGSMSLAFMFSINVRLTFISIIPLPFIIFIMIFFGRLIQNRFKEVQDSFSDISANTQEAFSGIRVIKGFRQESKEAENFFNKCDFYVDKNMNLIKIWGLFFPSVTLFASISTALFYLVGSRFSINGSLSIGQFVSFTFYLNTIVWPMMAIGFVFNMFHRGIASANRILDLMNTSSEIKENVNHAIDTVKGDIYINNLSFSYSDFVDKYTITKDNYALETHMAKSEKKDNVNGISKSENANTNEINFVAKNENEKISDGEKKQKNENPIEKKTYVLKDITLTIPSGSSLGIMGKPGSGKTTLAALLFRLFPVEDGTISIDGYDINYIPLKLLRSKIGYVPQDSFLFSDSIANNIGYGIEEEKIDRKQILDFAKLSHVYNDIMGYEKNFDTVVGERGITLSGGQKQRVSISRALIINPSILILDDALSAVDAQTEKKILKSLSSEIKKRTSIIIAHRVSTVKDCDQIIVLENGEITERGTHDELLKNNSYYAKLYNLQKLEDKTLENME